MGKNAIVMDNNGNEPPGQAILGQGTTFSAACGKKSCRRRPCAGIASALGTGGCARQIILRTDFQGQSFTHFKGQSNDLSSTWEERAERPNLLETRRVHPGHCNRRAGDWRACVARRNGWESGHAGRNAGTGDGERFDHLQPRRCVRHNAFDPQPDGWRDRLAQSQGKRREKRERARQIPDSRPRRRCRLRVVHRPAAQPGPRQCANGDADPVADLPRPDRR